MDLKTFKMEARKERLEKRENDKYKRNHIIAYFCVMTLMFIFVLYLDKIV